MGDSTMRNLKGTLKVALFALVLAVFAGPSQARITVDAFGGELEVEGFLKSEVRSRILNGKSYLGQWINKFQVEAALSYNDIGIFDELTFVAIARPEYDIVQDMGDLSSNHIGEGTTGVSTSDRQPFDITTDALGWGGFGFVGLGSTSTGGIGKMITGGLENPSWAAQNFEVAFSQDVNGNKTYNSGAMANVGGSAFPLVVQKSSNLNLDCDRCTDLNIDNIDVATGNTDSNGRLYPFRELYADAVIGDFWIRLGKQQIVWGKTDFFRLQDLINPVDYGQHFFFDSFEDIRIPQWMASVQWKAGSWGPLTDNAIQVIWNFDEFQGVGLGNPSTFWAHPFSKDISTFAIYNTYFSVEPCVTPMMAAATDKKAYFATTLDNSKLRAEDSCGYLGANDTRKPSGFGQPVGLNANLRPDWDINNTEAGFRWEFRLSDFRFAVSHWYGWNDVPVFRFHSVNMPTRHLTAAGIKANLPTDVLIGDLKWARNVVSADGTDYSTGDLLTLAKAEATASGTAGLGTSTLGYVDPIVVTTPIHAAHILAEYATSSDMKTAATNAIADGNFANLWAAVAPGLVTGSDWNQGFGLGNCAAPGGGLFCSPLAGGQTSMVYKQAHTLGLAMDYFESWSGVVMRIESSWTFDEIYNNTWRSDWVDEGDVMRFSLGFDRPTFIPFLNKDRTFFLSLQIFDTWYWDHEGDKNTGMFVDEHNWITTFFFIGNYMRDKLKPIGFYVWEEASNSHVAGFNVEWLIDNHWSIKGGFHLIWGGTNNTTHDTGPFTNYITQGAGATQNPYVTSVFGPGRQGIGSVRNYDELTFELKYQF